MAKMEYNTVKSCEEIPLSPRFGGILGKKWRRHPTRTLTSCFAPPLHIQGISPFRFFLYLCILDVKYKHITITY